MLGFEYSENFDKMLDNGGGVEHCGYLREMPNLVDEEESPPELSFDDRKIVIGGEDDDDDDMDRCSSSSNSSSIGNNSDEEQHQNSDDKEEEEVQSSSCIYNNNNVGGCGCGGSGGGCGGGANFDDAIQALENALPISKRGISRFYDGKSKSFTSLTDAASASGSVKEIVKPENAYAKRQRNLLANNLMYGDNKKKNKIYSSFHQLHQLGHTRGSRGGGISKRTTNTTTLALAVAMSSTTNFNNRSSPCSSPRQTTRQSNGGGGPLLSASSSSLLSPRAHRNFSALRSFFFH